MKKPLNKAQTAFVNTLLQQMQVKPFNQISVSELSEAAEYDRRTFYRYFQTKEDILYLYSAVLLEAMANDMKREALTPRSGFLAYFKFWDTHRDFLTLLEKQGFLYFLAEKQDQLLYQHVGLSVQDNLPNRLEQVPEFSQYAYYFTLGGLWQVLVFWIRTGMRQTPEQLTQYTLDLFTEMQKLME